MSMNYLCMLYALMLTLTSTNTILQCMNVTQKLSLNRTQPTLKKLWTPEKGRYLSQKVDQLVSAFYHPLYEKFLDPLYLGNKGKYWGNDLRETLLGNKTTDKDLQSIHKDYVSWKKKLTPLQREFWQSHINTYEQAYDASAKNLQKSKPLDDFLHHQTDNRRKDYFQQRFVEQRVLPMNRVEEHASDFV